MDRNSKISCNSHLKPYMLPHEYTVSSCYEETARFCASVYPLVYPIFLMVYPSLNRLSTYEMNFCLAVTVAEIAGTDALGK